MPSGWRVKPFWQISTDHCVRHVARWRVTHPCRSVKSVRRNNCGRVSHRSHRFSQIYIYMIWLMLPSWTWNVISTRCLFVNAPLRGIKKITEYKEYKYVILYTIDMISIIFFIFDDILYIRVYSLFHRRWSVKSPKDAREHYTLL